MYTGARGTAGGIGPDRAGNRYHVYTNVGIRRIRVFKFAFRFKAFRFLFLDDFFAFDQTVLTVAALGLTLLPDGSTAGAGIKIHDLCSRDLIPLAIPEPGSCRVSDSIDHTDNPADYQRRNSDRE